EIDYSVTVPPEALHGDWVSLGLEADGRVLGRARLQLFRPVSIRLAQPLQFHLGSQVRLAAEPPTAVVETRAGGNVEVVIRTTPLQIQPSHLEAAGNDLEFSPASADITVGPVEERPVSFRVFGKGAATGIRDWRLRVTGGATTEAPMRIVLLP